MAGWLATVVVVITSPLWLPLLLAVVAVGLVWWAVGFVLERPTGSLTLFVAVLTGLAVADGAAGTGATSMAYSAIVLDAAVLAAAMSALVYVVHVPGRSRPSSFPLATWAAAACPLVYVIVKRSLDVSAAAAVASPRATATLVLAAVCPLLQAIASLRWWRHATPAGAAAAEARIFQRTMTAPFRQVTVAGLHTCIVGSPGAAGAGANAREASMANPLINPNAAAAKDWKQGPGGRAGGGGSPSQDAVQEALAAMHGGSTRPAIVFCHGYMSGTAMYMFNLEAFATEYRVFSIDWLGCGSSDRPHFHPTTTAETEEFFLSALEAWRQVVGLERFVLVGHSMGGYLCGVYATRHPRRVQHLVLVSPGGMAPPPSHVTGVAGTSGVVPKFMPSTPGGGSPTPRPIPPWLWSLVSWAWASDLTPGTILRCCGPCGPCLARTGARGRISRLVLSRPMVEVVSDFGEYFYHNVASPGSGEFALRHVFLPGAWAKVPIGPRLVAAATSSDASTRLTCPITVLYGGTHDWMNSKNGDMYVKPLAEAGIRATLHLISPGGHHLYLESPDTFNRAVLAELALTFAPATTLLPAVGMPILEGGTEGEGRTARAVLLGAISTPLPGSPSVVPSPRGRDGEGGHLVHAPDGTVALPSSTGGQPTGRASPYPRPPSLREDIIQAVATME